MSLLSWTSIPPLTPSHPSTLSQSTWFELLASYRKCPLAIFLHMVIYTFWIFIGRTEAEAEAPILWPPEAKSGLIGEDPVAGKEWGQEKKGTTEDGGMVLWHQWLSGHEFEETQGDSEWQRSLACCSLWGGRESSGWTTTIATMYMFPCYFLSWSHPVLPQLCPQVPFLCLHLHCCDRSLAFKMIIDTVALISIIIFLDPFFSMWPTFKVFIEFVSVLHFVCLTKRHMGS